MKVSDLIERLQKAPQDATVVCPRWAGDGGEEDLVDIEIAEHQNGYNVLGAIRDDSEWEKCGDVRQSYFVIRG